MFRYLSSVSLLLAMILFYRFDSPYMILPLVFAILGTVFGAMSIKKKESGFLGKITFTMNLLLLLVGMLILLFSLLWVTSAKP